MGHSRRGLPCRVSFGLPEQSAIVYCEACSGALPGTALQCACQQSFVVGCWPGAGPSRIVVGSHRSKALRACGCSSLALLLQVRSPPGPMERTITAGVGNAVEALPCCGAVQGTFRGFPEQSQQPRIESPSGRAAGSHASRAGTRVSGTPLLSFSWSENRAVR